MAKISRQQYASLYGPTVGDKIRLGDTSLFAEIEHDHTVYGEECWTGAGRVMRDGMAYDAHTSRADGAIDMLIENATIIDPVLGVIKADIGVRDGKIAGEASLEHSQSTWTEHRGEIRIVIAPSQRGQGLGGVLAQEVFALAKELELELLTAQMIASQNTAQAVFRGLGFEPVAVLPAFAVDQRGQTHDLVVMMRDLSAEGSEVRTAIEGAKTLLNKLRGH